MAVGSQPVQSSRRPVTPAGLPTRSGPADQEKRNRWFTVPAGIRLHTNARAMEGGGCGRGCSSAVANSRLPAGAGALPSAAGPATGESLACPVRGLIAGEEALNVVVRASTTGALRPQPATRLLTAPRCTTHCWPPAAEGWFMRDLRIRQRPRSATLHDVTATPS